LNPEENCRGSEGLQTPWSWPVATGIVGSVGLYSYGPLPVISTYNPIYRIYNPIYNQL
jgi:hypothetical protein